MDTIILLEGSPDNTVYDKDDCDVYVTFEGQKSYKTVF
jgi:hypothetical protein